MGKILVLLLLTGGLLCAEPRTVALTSFGHPVQAVVADGVLQWNLPGDDAVAQGTVNWYGDTPQNLRNARLVVLPDGTAGMAVLGNRSGRDGLFLLSPTWEGAELWSGDAWMMAPTGQTIADYRWIVDGTRVFTALWTASAVIAKGGRERNGYQTDSAALADGSQAQVGVWSWDDGSQTWAVVAAVRTSAGWAPSVWVWSGGRLTAQAVNTVNTDLADAPASLDAIPPQNGSNAVVLKQGSMWAVWSWRSWGATGVQTITLPSAALGSSLGRAGEPAFFWWLRSGQAAGQATPQLGTAALVDWAVNLPGSVVWSSDVTPLGDRWRVWLLLQTSSGNGLYRLEVLPQGTASLDQAGDIPAGLTALDLSFDSGGWRVASLDHSQQWTLDAAAPSLTAMPSRPHSPLGPNP